MDLATVADELYARPLDDFVPARNERAKAAKADGDKDLFDAVKALPKPSTAAWVVNMLVRHQADQVQQVLELGASLREAQQNLDGEELRQLNRQRRQLTSAVTRGARALARELGHKVGESVASQVEETLHAAMVAQAAADAVRTGLLVRSLAASGLGEVDLDGAVAVPGALGGSATPASEQAPGRPKLSVVQDDSRAIEEAEETVAKATEELAAAEKELAGRNRTVADLEARSMELQAKLDELRRMVEDTENELEHVEEELGSAEDERDEASAEVDEARAATEDAQAVLDRLRS